MAKYDTPPFMNRDGDSLIYNEKDMELIYFVPEKHFESKIAQEYGPYITLVGEFNYARFKNGKLVGKITQFYFPTLFMCKPDHMDKISSKELSSKYPKEYKDDNSDYRMLIFKYGDQLVNSVHVPQMMDNVEQLFKLFFISGNIPNTVSYDTIHNHFKDNMNLNGDDYGITMQLFGMITSEICRDPDDESNPFRLSKSINTDMKSYKSVSVKAIPGYVDPYSSITSEYYDKALTNAILLTQKGERAASPIEKVFTTS